MCLAKAYVEKDGKRDFFMSDVASIEIEGKNLTLKDLFGEKKEIAATIREIDFVGSSLWLDISGKGGE